MPDQPAPEQTPAERTEVDAEAPALDGEHHGIVGSVISAGAGALEGVGRAVGSVGHRAARTGGAITGDFIEGLDVDALLDRIDINRLLERVDLNALLERADISAVLARTTTGVFGRVMQVIRAHLVALDVRVAAVVRHMVKTAATVPDEPLAELPLPVAPPASAPATAPTPTPTWRDRRAGSVSRLAAAVVDAVVVTTGFAVAVAVISAVWSAIGGHSFDLPTRDSATWSIGFAAWFFLYYWIGWSLGSATLGKALVGLRVVQRTGAPIRPGHAALRVIGLAIELATLGILLIGVLVGRERRAFHDVVARTTVVWDWEAVPAQ